MLILGCELQGTGTWNRRVETIQLLIYTLISLSYEGGLEHVHGYSSRRRVAMNARAGT